MSDKSATIDAEAWTGHLPGGWPRASDHPLPKPIEAGESLRKSIIGACILLYFGIAQWLPFRQETQKRIAPAVVALLGGLWMVRRSFRIYRQPRTVLTVDERGLSWPGGYARTIPWSDITSAHHNRLFFPTPWLPGVYIRVRDSLGCGPRTLGWPVTSGIEGLEGLRPLPWMLDVKPRVIFATIQSYRAHYGGAREV